MTDNPDQSEPLPDTPFLQNVLEQPAALTQAIAGYEDGDRSRLNEFARLAEGRWLAFIGMGSSLYAPYCAALYLDTLGRWAVTLDASEVLHYHGGSLPTDALPVLVSQSGESVELVRLAEGWREKPYAAITNDLESSLARGAAVTLPLHAGVESATSSKTFVNTVGVSLLAAAAIVDEVNPMLDDLRGAVKALLGSLRSAQRQVAWLDRVIGFPPFLDVVGRGPALVAAQQSALILREAAGVLGAAHSIGLLRHGPIHDIGPGRCVLVFSSCGSTGTLAEGLVDDLLDRGACVAWVTNDLEEYDSGIQNPQDPEPIGLRLRHPRLATFGFRQVPEYLFPIPAIAATEFLACLWAARQGIVPGERVEKVTTQE